jgi:hypothetical protein
MLTERLPSKLERGSFSGHGIMEQPHSIPSMEGVDMSFAKKRNMRRRDIGIVGWRGGRYRFSVAGGNFGPYDDQEFRFDLEMT